MGGPSSNSAAEFSKIGDFQPRCSVRMRLGYQSKNLFDFLPGGIFYFLTKIFRQEEHFPTN